jgi:hypothetical protein
MFRTMWPTAMSPLENGRSACHGLASLAAIARNPQRKSKAGVRSWDFSTRGPGLLRFGAADFLHHVVDDSFRADITPGPRVILAFYHR